jgi:hypothetical protein
MMEAPSAWTISPPVYSAAAIAVPEIFVFSQKIRFSRLTVFFRRLPCSPRLKRDSRSRKTKELVLAYFGTANWNSILSRQDENGNSPSAGAL